MGEAPKKCGWCILGVSRISNDFCIALVTNGSTIASVGARDAGRAKEFADRFGARSSHGSYEAALAAPGVDVVYVATVHTSHASLVKLALEAGKHVVCEKPMTVNEPEMRELVDLARSKGLFLMEAMWTRFFPAIRKAREVLASGEIGEAKYVQGDFGFEAPTEESSRLWDPKQAGGGMLEIGCYVVQAATMVFGGTVPDTIACSGQLSSTGCDEDGLLSLTWAGKGGASLMFTLKANTPEHVTIIGSKGNIEIRSPAHCPTKIIVNRMKGRGLFEPEEFTFELPKCSEGHSMNFPNSEGFLYQVQAVEKCLGDGLKECPDITLDESMAIVRIMDTFRKQIGVVYPFET